MKITKKKDLPLGVVYKPRAESLLRKNIIKIPHENQGFQHKKIINFFSKNTLDGECTLTYNAGEINQPRP